MPCFELSDRGLRFELRFSGPCCSTYERQVSRFKLEIEAVVYRHSQRGSHQNCQYLLPASLVTTYLFEHHHQVLGADLDLDPGRTPGSNHVQPPEISRRIDSLLVHQGSMEMCLRVWSSCRDCQGCSTELIGCLRCFGDKRVGR